jgi:hypothetical protein
MMCLTDHAVLKFDSSGTCLWAWGGGGPGADLGYAVSADGNGNCYVTGSCSPLAVFGSTIINSQGSTEAFTVKLDSTASCLWAKQSVGKSLNTGLAIATDTEGNSTVTGYINGSVTFEGIQLSPFFNASIIFIARYDIGGNCQWLSGSNRIKTMEWIGHAKRCVFLSLASR